MCADLDWLHRQVELPFSIPHDEDEWLQTFEAVSKMTNWKSLLKRAIKVHLQKQKIGWQTGHFHDMIYKELSLHSLTPVVDAILPLCESNWLCDLCDAQFDTRQKLAVHKAKKHNKLSDERDYVQSSVCGGCLCDFWTTRRLQQHLARRENGCFSRLHGAREPDTTAHIVLPAHLQGIKWLPAHRSHHGPLRPTPRQRAVIQLRSRLQTQETRVHDLGLDLNQAVLGPAWDVLWCHFDSCLRQFLNASDATFDFQSALLQPDDDRFTHAHIVGVLFQWSRSKMPPDDETQCVAWHAQVQTLLDDLGVTGCLQQLATLREQLDCELQADDEVDLVERSHGPKKPRERKHPITDGLRLEADREQERCQIKWSFQSQPCRGLQPHVQLLIHLYSGRRRKGDLHDCFLHFLPSEGQFLVISLDTAIDSKMNAMDPAVWSMLHQAASNGFVRGLVLGPPCETWTSARHEQLVDRCGPRPLRLCLFPWGRCDIPLTGRELDQIGVGTLLLLRGLWLAVCVAFSGGSVVLEHPSMPVQPDRASIWRTAIVRTLLEELQIFRIVRSNNGSSVLEV